MALFFLGAHEASHEALTKLLHSFEGGSALADALFEGFPFQLQLLLSESETLHAEAIDANDTDNGGADDEEGYPTGDKAAAAKRDHVGGRQNEKLRHQTGKNASDNGRPDAPLYRDKCDGSIEGDIRFAGSQERPQKDVKSHGCGDRDDGAGIAGSRVRGASYFRDAGGRGPNPGENA